MLSWLRDLSDWIRTKLADKTDFSYIEKSVIGDNTIYLVYDSDQVFDQDRFPGMTRFYLISNSESENDLMLIMINLTKVRLRSTESVHTWRRQLEIKIRAEISEQSDIAGTHLFIVAWLSKKPIIGRYVQNQLRQFKAFECTEAIVFDAVGTTYIRLGVPFDKPSKLILEAIAKYIARMTSGELNTWEMLVRYLEDRNHETNWITWLEFFTRKILREPGHLIQPKKVSYRRPKNQN